MESKRRNSKPGGKGKTEPRLSRASAPADLSPADWQRALRRQFGREQSFGLENLGDDPFFSEFRVSSGWPMHSPQSPRACAGRHRKPRGRPQPGAA
jgi:hypothetical protein